MSKKTDLFEGEIVESASHFQRVPLNIPEWMQSLGIQPGARIIDVQRVGGSGSKTDVFIHLENSEPIKISAKLSSADYFGNWYSHGRVMEEFGEEAFYRLVSDCTSWANDWKHNESASLFVGVSICFGKRSGNTQREFTDVFTYDDIVKVVAGFGTGNSVANCLFVSNKVPHSVDEFFSKLEPIDEETILRLSRNFKVVYRPINPMTEGTNRGKAIYTQFKPHEPLTEATTISTLNELKELGEFITVEPNSLNHNRLLDELENYYNIHIPRK